MNNKKGFTLVEILVGLTIVAVLGATTIPSMMGFIDDRKAKECDIRRDEIFKMYEVVRRDGDREISVDDLKAFVQSNWGSESPCPSGAKYRYPVAGIEPKTGYLNVVIICGTHGSNNREGLYVLAKTMQDIYYEILNMEGVTGSEKRKLIGEEIKKLTGVDVTFQFPNERLYNEDFRKIAIEVTGGKWEALDENINSKISSSKLYVQTYVQPEGDVIIYANTLDHIPPKGTGTPWKATAIYNPEDGYWYKPKAGLKPSYTDLAGLSKPEKSNWNAIKEELETEWERIE